jgi:hypothetical protein
MDALARGLVRQTGVLSGSMWETLSAIAKAWEHQLVAQLASTLDWLLWVQQLELHSVRLMAGLSGSQSAC